MALSLTRLNTDPFVRSLFQVILLFGVGFLAVTQLNFCFLLINHQLHFVEATYLQDFILSFLRLPFEQEFASLGSVLAGVIPVMVSAVCFQYDSTNRVTSNELNNIGRSVLALLVFGFIFGIIAIAFAGLFQDIIIEILGGGPNNDPLAKAANEAVRVAIRNTLSAIVAFQAFYAIQLLGDRQ